MHIDVHVLGTALLASNAWNYYRMTRDEEWLKHTGYPIIIAAADFVQSCFIRDMNGRSVN